MARIHGRSAVKVEALNTRSNVVSWLLISCTFLTLASVIPMWSHWFELSASLGFYPATCVLTAITGAALIVSLWVNTDNE